MTSGGAAEKKLDAPAAFGAEACMREPDVAQVALHVLVCSLLRVRVKLIASK